MLTSQRAASTSECGVRAPSLQGLPIRHGIAYGSPPFPTMSHSIEAELAAIEQQLDERREEEGVEDGLLAEVIEGEGDTVIDGQSFNWSRGDVIAIPSWRPFHHVARREDKAP